MGDDIRPIIHEPWIVPNHGIVPGGYLLPPLQKWMARLIINRRYDLCHYHALGKNYLPLMHRTNGLFHSLYLVISRTSTDSDAVAEIRRRIAGDSALVIGTFGTYREEIAPKLRAIFPLLLDKPGRVGFLIGRNGPDSQDSTEGGLPVVTTDELPASRGVAIPSGLRRFDPALSRWSDY